MTDEYDTGMGTTPRLWQMESEAVDGEKLPNAINKAIRALCDGKARVTPTSDTDTRLLLLDYELRSSWWAQWMGTAALQSISASYYAWKVNRKFVRWQRSVALARLVEARRRNQETP